MTKEKEKHILHITIYIVYNIATTTIIQYKMSYTYRRTGENVGMTVI